MEPLGTYLSCHQGRLGLHVPEGVLPGFLLEAFSLAANGRTEEAAGLIDDARVAQVRDMQEQRHGAYVLAMLILAMTLHRTGDSKAAASWYEEILREEAHPIVLNELAELYQAEGLFSKARRYREQALGIDPHNRGIMGNYAVDLMAAGELEQGVDMMRQLVEAGEGSGQLHSSYLFYLHYLSGVTQSQLLQAHRRWGALCAPAPRTLPGHGNSIDPDRPLRIGYVSADFRRHSAGYTIEALMAGDRGDDIELYGYGNVALPDEVTQRMADQLDHYRSILGMDDRTAARLIANDRIDILVALAGHSSGHRLDIFARKPAPLQVEYQGINTTGMTQMDYRFTDELLDPPTAAAGYVENLYYLKGGWTCYCPPECAPDVGPLPSQSQDHVTFGAFHGSLKVNREVVALWADVLGRVPGSRLIMKCPGGRDPELRKRYSEWFGACGLDTQRLEILGWLSPEEHLALYHRVDIALDAFPFSGGITTLEAMWMGVPTISLVGETCVSRQGLMVLTHVGLGCFACHTRSEYVTKAVTLAQQTDALVRIRATLRARMEASPLCDKQRITSELETAYRTIWRRWCAARQQSRHDIREKGVLL